MNEDKIDSLLQLANYESLKYISLASITCLENKNIENILQACPQ